MDIPGHLEDGHFGVHYWGATSSICIVTACCVRYDECWYAEKEGVERRKERSNGGPRRVIGGRGIILRSRVERKGGRMI